MHVLITDSGLKPALDHVDWWCKHASKKLASFFDFDFQSVQLVHTDSGASSDAAVNELTSVITSMVNARVQLAGQGYIVRKVNNNKM